MVYKTTNMQEVTVLNNQDLTLSKENVNTNILSHFNKDQIVFLLGQVKDSRNQMLLQFMWRTGCRVSEVIQIKKKDIDFANDIINIRWLKNRKYNFRIIPMHKSLKSPLLMYTSKLKADDVLFDISRQRVYQICDKLGFDHPHKIRHSFAVNFLRQINNPMGIVILQNLLGHKSIETTMNYLKIVPMQMAEAMKNVEFD